MAWLRPSEKFTTGRPEIGSPPSSAGGQPAVHRLRRDGFETIASSSSKTNGTAKLLW